MAADRGQGRAQTAAVKDDEAGATISYWVSLAKAVGNGKTASLGRCFGGGWSLNAALRNDPDATLIYSVQVTADTVDLAKLEAPYLAIMVGSVNRLIQI